MAEASSTPAGDAISPRSRSSADRARSRTAEGRHEEGVAGQTLHDGKDVDRCHGKAARHHGAFGWQPGSLNRDVSHP
ncbi:hypothetical protein D9599_21935 [Roseomonas sp. KE2513]|nr:hypothetical protein [Roseomonas sp. KE2513]